MYYLYNSTFTLVSKIKILGFSDEKIAVKKPKIEIIFKQSNNSKSKYKTQFFVDKVVLYDKHKNEYQIYIDKIIVNYNDSINLNEISFFIYSQPLGYLYFLNNFHVIHGSCVSYKDKAISFIGRSGSGKSTIAALMNDDNFKILSEDLTITDNDLNIQKTSDLIKLAPEIHEIFKTKISKLSNYKDFRGRSIYDAKNIYFQERSKLNKCYFINWSNSKEIKISRMKSLDIFKYLLTYSYGTLDIENQSIDFIYKMNFIDNIIRNIDFYLLEQPKDLENIGSNINKVKDHIIYA